MIHSTTKSRRLKRLANSILAATVLTVLSCTTATAADDAWVFRRSYFSHVLPPEVQAHYPMPESRSAYRRPLVDVYPGFSVQGSYRYYPMQIFDGRSMDTTIYQQFSIQFQP